MASETAKQATGINDALSEERRMDEYTCEHCEYSTDEEGLLVCTLDDRVKDDDMTCEKWIRKREEWE